MGWYYYKTTRGGGRRKKIQFIYAYTVFMRWQPIIGSI